MLIFLSWPIEARKTTSIFTGVALQVAAAALRVRMVR
jgi:hypothetical protein